jgi:hypothetical protein
MSRKSWKRIAVAVMLAGLCTLMAPPQASAATSLDVGGIFTPTLKMWNTALGWLHHILPVFGSSQPPKFGAGQSSDGRAKSGRIPSQVQ